ncbi:MAG TPA: Mrp/NBP35 family ATP-binding protein [Pantanalinema sp.]
MATAEQVIKALSTVNDPELHKDLVTLKMIDEVEVEGGVARFKVILTTPACPLKGKIEADCVEAVKRLVPGITDVEITWGASVPVSLQPSAVPGIKHAIAIGSGKGGVGKSTVTLNLALALAETGAKVGVLDADIYGPSIPLMMGVNEKPYILDGKILPLEKYGIKLMSMGFLLKSPEDPVIWRGPMLAGVLQQFVRDVSWGDLDYLLIDLPPGTGDVPLSLSQQIPLSGVAIVITPQPVAQQIGMKSLRMFQQLPAQVPILGIIENMSTFVCPNCDHSTPIFSTGGGARTSELTSLPLLGEIPLDPKIRAGGDEGKPVFVAEPQSPQAEAFRTIARHMAGQVSVRHFARLELPVLG